MFWGVGDYTRSWDGIEG